ncbi:MAG: PVC-type heme-binding CxxCH protein [Gemmataceae bacterium]
MPARFFLPLLALLICCCPSLGQRQFGFDNRKASGQPYLKPTETVKRFEIAEGYQANLFAGEPDLINPIAFTIDERGRIWVVENFEYPKRTPPGKKPRDRIKILEDTNGDGKCDKVTIWAEGKHLPHRWDLASGIEVGNGGVYLGAPPYLFFLQDTDGDGKCDKQDILLKGFGSQDTHETLNTFQWGPDSKLYGLHGVFTRSKVGDVRLNAAVWRYTPETKKFEVFAEGTSNPWGMDFDQWGQCHLVCCVIPHLFHMVPGGTYKRQAGSSFNPYAYGLLPESCDHTHHRVSGWAHAGLMVLQGDHVPEAYRGSVIMGSIHGCSLKRDVLRRAGSTFRAGDAPDFLVSNDKNFRPINLRWGPDGAIYVIDWHDQNPCHQAHPDSWDKKRGRLYRIARTNFKPSKTKDLTDATTKQLVSLLDNDNPYWYRTAQRLLHERSDDGSREFLKKALAGSKDDVLTLRKLWALYASDGFDESAAQLALAHKNKWIRSWGVRLLGEAGEVSPVFLKRLTQMAKDDPSPEVRLQLASTCQQLKKQDVLPILHNLMAHKKDAKDRFLPLMIWLAYEPRVARTYQVPLEWLADNASGNPLATNEIVPRTLRRLATTGNKEAIAACVSFLGRVDDSLVRERGLEGMLAALKNRQLSPPAEWRRVFSALVRDNSPRVKELARRLAVNFQDKQAIALALKIARDVSAKVVIRVEAIDDLALAQPKGAASLLTQLVMKPGENQKVRERACRALSNFEGGEIGEQILSGWEKYPQALKTEVVNMLSSRKNWARMLLDRVGDKKIARGDLSDNTILRIRSFEDSGLNKRIETVWGRYRKTPKELQQLIGKMYAELDKGGASFHRGRLVFEKTCAKCHTFDGKGAKVGPNLDGASREIDYMVINVIDPNRVIGKPYYNHIVQLKNGRLESGLLVNEDDQSLTLKAENDAVKVLLKKDVARRKIVEKSVMPEGLAYNMSVQNFRDLVRYTMAHPFPPSMTLVGPVQLGRIQARDLVSRKGNVKALSRTVPIPVTGKLQLPELKRRRAESVLVVVEVVAPKAMKTTLLLGTNSSTKVWFDDRVIRNYVGSSGKARADQFQIPVELKKGNNRFVFECWSRGDDKVLYGRFRDPDRILQYPTVEK